MNLTGEADNRVCLGRCENCPTATRIADVLQEKREVAEDAASRMLGDTLDNEADSLFDALKEFPEIAERTKEGGPGIALPVPTKDGFRFVKSGEEMAEAVRKGLAEGMDRLDEEETSLADWVAECSGPLVMRAVKEGREVTVRVCMNPDLPDGELQADPTTVIRRTV